MSGVTSAGVMTAVAGGLAAKVLGDMMMPAGGANIPPPTVAAPEAAPVAPSAQSPAKAIQERTLAQSYAANNVLTAGDTRLSDKLG